MCVIMLTNFICLFFFSLTVTFHFAFAWPLWNCEHRWSATKKNNLLSASPTGCLLRFMHVAVRSDKAFTGGNKKKRKETEAQYACNMHPKGWRGAPSPLIPGGDPSWISSPLLSTGRYSIPSLLVPEGDPFWLLGALELTGRYTIPEEVERRAIPSTYVNPCRYPGWRLARNRRPRCMIKLHGTIRKNKLAPH